MAETISESLQDIISSIREMPHEEVYIDYSFGRKSSLLAYCAIQAGKKVTLRFIRAMDRIYPDVLEEMNKVTDVWKNLGCTFETIDINCSRKGPGDSICLRVRIKFRNANPEKFFLLTSTKDTFEKYSKLAENRAYPLKNYSIRELHYLSGSIKAIPHLDLVKFNCSHICSNPICPYWQALRPDALEKYKRWTTTEEVKGGKDEPR